MITLNKHKDNTFLCWLKDGRHRRPLYWHPRKDPKLRLAIDSLDSFNEETVRDQFKISHAQMQTILKHLKRNATLEGQLQSKFFKVKKFIENSLYTSIDLRGGPQELLVDYPPGNDTWGELEVVLGGSGSGKTTHLVKKILSNLNGLNTDGNSCGLATNS